ncbi:amidohydrolase family protein [Streptomyces sp. NPDC007872]|uniref:metal-dependent hydrolase family protein n=1 Tax=Streptomyces sp. NPDC007872 TaxID=3364782 RepID=UPI00367A476B
MPEHRPHRTVLRPERLWTGLHDRPHHGGQVVVENGRIVSVDTTTTDPSDTDAVVDLPGCTLLPGLIDCHVHLADENADGDSAPYQVLTALPAMRALLDNGFTTVRDLGSAHQPLNVALRNAVEEGLITGPRIVAAPNIISPRGGHEDKAPGLAQRYGAQIGTVADGPDEIRRAVRRQARDGADWIKYAGSGGFSSPADSPDSVSYAQEEVDVLVATARDLRLSCAVHAFADEAVRRAVRAGVRSVEHGTFATPATYAMMKREGVFLVPTQYCQRLFLDHLDDEDFWRDKPAHLPRSYRSFAGLLREGLHQQATADVRIAFGTDAGMFPHRDNWREFLTLVDHGLTPLRALRAATITAAALLDRPDLGQITPEAVADLVAVEGNPLTDIEAMGRVRLVMSGGHAVANPGHFATDHHTHHRQLPSEVLDRQA